MNIKRENIGLLNELITVELLASDYQGQVEKSLKDLKRKANIPGFRPGHVPMGMIEKMYKKSVVVEEVSKLTNDEFYKYLTDNALNIIFEPIAREDKTQGDFEKVENFSFSFEIGLRPEIAINYAEAKKVTLHKVIAAEQEIDKELTDMRRRVGKFSSTEEVAEQDMLLVAVTPENGEEFTASLFLEYVKDSELKSFIGKKLSEEMDIDTTKIFKSDYERATFLKRKTEELENAPQSVHIKIDAIHHRELAEINDEFFSRLFPDGSVTNETALRNKIKEQIELRHINETGAVFRSKVFEVLMEKTPIELPDAFIKRYLVENKKQYTAENIEEEYEKIKKSVAYQLIENQIIEDCDIKVDNDDMMQYMEDYVRMSYFGTTAKLDDEMEKQVALFVQQMTKNQENVKNAYENLLFDRMTAGLIVKLQPKPKELHFDDFIAEISEKKDKNKKEDKADISEEKEEKPKVAKPRTKKKVETE